MKRILVLFLILTGGIFAQGVVDGRNSTTTTLDSAATFTGVQSACYSYSSITVNVFSDSSGILIVQFANTNDNYDKEVIWNYRGGDTTTNFTTPVLAPYYRVLFTNTADSQLVFRLYTYLNRAFVPATGLNGRMQVEEKGSFKDSTFLKFNSIIAQLATIVTNQGVLLDTLLNRVNDIGDSARVLGVTMQMQNMYRNQFLATIDSTLDTVKNNQINGNQLSKPYLPYMYYEAEFGATKDTVEQIYSNLYYKAYVEIYNPNATADTVSIQVMSNAKGGYASDIFGLRNLKSGDYEADNAVVVIPATKTYKYEIMDLRVSQVRIMTLSTKTRAANLVIGTYGIN